jgi:hypothetical protein
MIEHTVPRDYTDIANVQDRVEDALLAKRNVCGVALGHKLVDGEDTGERALTVLVESKLPPDLLTEDDLVPERVDEIVTDVLETGPLFAGGHDPRARSRRSETDDDAGAFALQNRARPAQGGYSVGHFRITAGTLGTCCYDLRAFPGSPRDYYVLSNNHVLANSNDANVGDRILQPGPIDGGTIANDTIARLTRWVPIRFIAGGDAPCNYVDAAIAAGDFRDLDRQIYWIGHIQRLYNQPEPGDILMKTGRTTNFTTGRVQNINATVNVNFGGGRVARFCRQILADSMSAPGDSGSVVVDLDRRGVGLLFAGSAVVTILNHLNWVQTLLQVRVAEQ